MFLDSKLSDLIKSSITDDQVTLIISERQYGAIIKLNLISTEGKKNWHISQFNINHSITKKEELASCILKEAIKTVYKKYPSKIYVSNASVTLEKRKDFYLKNNFVKKDNYFIYG